MKSRDTFRLNTKELMTRQGLKVKDLADMVGLSPSYLSLVLSGERANLADRHKDAIAIALGTSVADLYLERPGRAKDASDLSGDDSESPPTGVLLQRSRDIAPFEAFLRALNVTDQSLLSAYYRELNSLPDDLVLRFGSMFRNVLTAWQAEAGSVAAPSPRTELALLEPDGRSLLWMIAYTSSEGLAAMLDLLREVLMWPLDKIHMELEPLRAAGLAAIVSTGPSGTDDAVAVKAADDVCHSDLAGWIPVGLWQSALRALARRLESHPSADPVSIAKTFLEAGDLRNAREWYLAAASSADLAKLWRVAKNHLLLASSLEAVFWAPEEDKASTTQMLVTVCQNLGEVDEALSYQERNLAYWDKAGPAADMVRGCLNAASMLARRQAWGIAAGYLQKALLLTPGDLSAEADAAEGDHIRATGWFRDAASRARDSQNPALEAIACQAHAEYLEGQDTSLAQGMLERSRWASAKLP